MKKTHTFPTEKILLYIIGSTWLLTYIFGLLLPVTSDAGKYAAISRIIYETGDWINLEIHHEPYLQKPPFLFWVTTPFFLLLTPSAFAFKLPVLLYSCIAVYSTFKLARMYYSKQIARLAAIILASSEFYFLFHNDIHTDSLLTANVIFSIWQIAEFLKSRKTIHALLAGLGVGLAVISKGPIGIFVPVTALFIHAIYFGQFKKIFSYKTVLGFVVTCLVLVLGLKGQYNQFGWEGLRFFFWENNAGRIAGRIKGGSTDYFFYFHTALYIFLPWGILFFISWFHEFRALFKTAFRKHEGELFSLGGITLYWIIISVASAKSPHYFMVLSPFMAILTAKWLIKAFDSEHLKKTQSLILWAQNFYTIGIWILLFILCIYCFPATNIALWISLATLALISFIPYKSLVHPAVARSLIAAIAINLAMNVHVFPNLFSYQSVIPACTIFNDEAGQDETLSIYRSEHRELFFYADRPGHFLYDEEDLAKFLPRGKDWIYTNDEGLKEIRESGTSHQLVKSFKHRSVSRLTGTYLNPKTREKALRNMHLVKLEQKGKRQK